MRFDPAIGTVRGMPTSSPAPTRGALAAAMLRLGDGDSDVPPGSPLPRRSTPSPHRFVATRPVVIGGFNYYLLNG